MKIVKPNRRSSAGYLVIAGLNAEVGFPTASNLAGGAVGVRGKATLTRVDSADAARARDTVGIEQGSAVDADIVGTVGIAQASAAYMSVDSDRQSVRCERRSPKQGTYKTQCHYGCPNTHIRYPTAQGTRSIHGRTADCSPSRACAVGPARRIDRCESSLVDTHHRIRSDCLCNQACTCRSAAA